MSVEPKGKGWMLETYPPWGRIASPECWIRYCALVTRLATGHPCRNGIATSAVKHLLVLANSFHEKAGVSQVCFSSSSLWFLAFEPSRLRRHPSIRTLLLSDFRSVQVGRSRFSRCCYLILDVGSHLLARKFG